jgi:hypothetical protein
MQESQLSANHNDWTATIEHRPNDWSAIPEHWYTNWYPSQNGSTVNPASSARDCDSAQNAATVNPAQDCVTTYLAQNAATVYPAQNAATVYPAQNAATVYPAQNAATLYPAQNVATVYPAQNAATVYPAQNVATVYPAQNAATVYPAHNKTNIGFETCIPHRQGYTRLANDYTPQLRSFSQQATQTRECQSDADAFPDEVTVLRAENAVQQQTIERLKCSLRAKNRFMLWDSAFPREVNEAVFRFYEHYVCRHFPRDRCVHDRSKCSRIHYLVTPRDLRYEFWLVRASKGNLLASKTYSELVYLAYKETWRNFPFILHAMQKIKNLLTRT